MFDTEDLTSEMESIGNLLCAVACDKVEQVEKTEKEERQEKHEALENQVKLLLGVVNGSPDLFLFDTMFSASMLSSIDRITNASSTQYGNLYSNGNVMLYKLYSLLQSRRQDDSSVLLLTGLAYEPSNFVQLPRKNQSLLVENGRQSPSHRALADILTS